MRIRGAILDELRRQDPVPRSIRRKARDLARGREAAMRVIGREPTTEELANHLGVDAETVWRWESEIESSVQLSLDQGTGDQDDPVPTPIRFLASDASEAPDAAISKEQEVALMREAILELGQQERTVLTLYYFEELKLHQIAKILGVTESRVSQICAKAIKRLREKLAPMRALA
jgi:RNA polymerase sigma factor for flagellar operon FliA